MVEAAARVEELRPKTSEEVIKRKRGGKRHTTRKEQGRKRSRGDSIHGAEARSRCDPHVHQIDAGLERKDRRESWQKENPQPYRSAERSTRTRRDMERDMERDMDRNRSSHHRTERPPIKIRILVAVARIGAIIGERGARVVKIRAESGATVWILDAKQNENLFHRVSSSMVIKILLFLWGVLLFFFCPALIVVCWMWVRRYVGGGVWVGLGCWGGLVAMRFKHAACCGSWRLTAQCGDCTPGNL